MDTVYLSRCKRNYIEGNTPANKQYRNSNDFKELLKIVIQKVSKNGIDTFYNYCMEGQFYVNLWTAHFILEYFNPKEIIKKNCIKIIHRYANGKLDIKIAIEEAEWLKKYSQGESPTGLMPRSSASL